MVFSSRERLVRGLGGELRDVVYSHDIATGKVSRVSRAKDEGLVIGGVAQDVTDDGRRALYVASPDFDSPDRYLYLAKVRTGGR